jgi:hypothetical protein
MTKATRAAERPRDLLLAGETGEALLEIRRAYLAGEVTAAQDRAMTLAAKVFAEKIAEAQITMRLQLASIARS